MQINLSELVNHAQNGDRGACSKLYQLTFKSSYYLALRITGNESFATQSIEESYKKAFSSIASLKNPESLEAWVKHITAVKSIELLKQNNQLVFDGQTVLPSEIIKDGSEFLPKGLEKSANAGKVINKIVDALPICQRVVTVLHYFNEMPVSHIARMLACTENDVKAELYSARSNIKKCIDRMINRETEIYPSVNKPLLATIFQLAGNQQTVDETLLREVFASATEGMFGFSAKQQPPAPETVSATIATPVSAESAPQAKTDGVNKIKQQKKKIIPDILKKLNALTKKQKITAAVCVAVAFVIIIVGAICIPKFADSSFDKPEETTSDVFGEISNEIDSEMLKQIELKADNYSLNLKDYYNFYNNEWQAMKFRFEYIDANDIPDLVLFGSRNEKNICIIHANANYVDMETSDFADDTYSGYENPENLWVGKKGHIVICEQSDNGKLLTFTEYLLEKEEDGSTVYDGVSEIRYENDFYEAKPAVGEKWYFWTADAPDDTQELSGWKEFEAKMHELLTEYHRLTNGYDVSDFVNSGKSLIEYLETAETTEYKFPNISGTSFIELPEASDLTVTTDAAVANVNWKESSVLNDSFALIENYNEKSCLVKMANTGYFGLIDLKGNIIVEPEYGRYFDYCSYGGSDVHYVMQDEDRNDHIIDMNTFKVDPQIHGGHGANDDVIPAGFDDIDRYHNGLAAAKKNGKWGYVDKNNNTVIPFEYEQVEDRFIADNCRGFDGTYIPVKKNGKMGIINKQNQVIVPFEYSVIMHGDDGVFIAQKNGKWGFIGIGIEPKEPKKPVSAERTPVWETNYLKTINHEAFENFNFILTDLDNNGVPDLILVMHRGTRGPLTATCMNGEYTDTYDDESSYYDYLYISKSGKIATSSLINFFENDPDTGKSYRNYDECFCYSYLENGAVHDSDYVHRVTIYDRDTDEIVGVRYYIYDENYNEVEISESEFNRIYKDITNNYTKAYETSVEDFKSSGKELTDYVQEF